MRILFPIAGLLIAVVSIVLDYRGVDPNAWYCRYGLCRFDQVFAAKSHSGDLLADVATLLKQDPANPTVWCSYAELLSSHGQVEKATAAFDHAVSLGPGMSPVLIRAAVFDFSHGREDHGLDMVNRILRGTNAYDEKIFAYLVQSGIGTYDLLGTAVPPVARPARAWLNYLRSKGSDHDLLQTWLWMGQNGLTDEKSAVELSWTLWERKSFQSAQEVWSDWLGPAKDGRLHPQRLANAGFQNEPNQSPFDWTLDNVAGAEISRHAGLDVHFTGEENVNFAHVRQFATVSPGRYRFSAEISADGITTDEGPLFHVFDPADPKRVSVETPQARGKISKSWTSVDFQVPSGTQALEIQLERHPTLRFDNRIAGTLHVYQVSLTPLARD